MPKYFYLSMSLLNTFMTMIAYSILLHNNNNNNKVKCAQKCYGKTFQITRNCPGLRQLFVCVQLFYSSRKARSAISTLLSRQPHFLFQINSVGSGRGRCLRIPKLKSHLNQPFWFSFLTLWLISIKVEAGDLNEGRIQSTSHDHECC